MTEPKRWIDEGPPEAIERLLSAASAEKPPEAGMARTLGVLGVGLGTAGAASTATASTAGASAAGGALGAASIGKASGVFAAGTVAKWGLVVTVVTAAGVAGKVATTHHASAPAAQVAAQVQTAAPVQTTPAASKPARPGPDIAPLAPLAASAGAAVVEAPAVARPSMASTLPKATPKGEPALAPAPEAPIDVERLKEEVALVDQARGALARGDARAAISALDDYDARFSARRFVPEALYLRMESLLRLNQNAAARSVASRLATSYPSSPHAARARQVLGGSIP